MTELLEPKDLAGLAYDPQNFRDLADAPLGQALWRHLKERDNQIRMLTATVLERAAVEPLGPGLVYEFGADIADNRVKQMIGHMVKQIMVALGCGLDRHGLRITRVGLFTSGARYHSGGQATRRRQ